MSRHAGSVGSVGQGMLRASSIAARKLGGEGKEVFRLT